jgi:hypothetical protein
MFNEYFNDAESEINVLRKLLAAFMNRKIYYLDLEWWVCIPDGGDRVAFVWRDTFEEACELYLDKWE